MSNSTLTKASRVFRGRSTAELIPTIQAELGPEAIVIARRSGLEGGIGGFFQRPFVEIEAQPAGRGGLHVDLYDGEPATPAPAPLLSTPPLGSAVPPLSTMAPESSPAPESFPAPESAEPRLSANAPESSELPLSAMAPELSEAPHGNLATAALDAAESFEGVLRPASLPSALPSNGVEPAAAAPDAFASLLAQASAASQPSSAGTSAGAWPIAAEASSELAMPRAAEPATTLQPTAATHDAEPPIHAERFQAAAPAQDLPAAKRTRAASAVLVELIGVGFDEPFAERLLDEASAHVLPFAPRIGLRRAVRTALERSIPVARPLPGRGAALAFVGPGGSGKTKCVAALAAAYRGGGALPVGCASLSTQADGETLHMVFTPRLRTPALARSQRALKALASARSEGVVLIDTPSLAPAERARTRELARLLEQARPDRAVVALPATLGARAAAQLLVALAPLAPTAIAITHADETDQLGVAVQAACVAGIAPEYLLTSARGARALTRTDPASLAARLLP